MQVDPRDSVESKWVESACLAEQESLCVTPRVNTHSEHSPGTGTGRVTVSPVGEGCGSAPAGGSGAGVHQVLGRVEAAGEQHLGRVDGLDEQEVELLALGGGEVPEHEVGR